MAHLRQFFDEYADALGQADIARMADAYAEAFMTTGPGFRMGMENDANFYAKLVQRARFYKQIGVDVVEVKNYLEAELGAGFWLTKVEWELLDEDLNTLVTFDNTYMVDASGDAPKIILAIAHNEEARMDAQGLTPA
jgi:hypothetical protein